MRFMDTREYEDLSLAAWVRFDGLDRRHNSLMLSDGWEAGDVHWQVQNDGVLVLGVRREQNVMAALYSPPDQIGQRHMGDWVLLCVSLDRDTGRIVHYLNGREVDAVEGQVPEVIRIGSAELGNWFNNTGSLRGLNGRIDFFAAWDRVLGPEEVAQLYRVGNPVR